MYHVLNLEIRLKFVNLFEILHYDNSFAIYVDCKLILLKSNLQIINFFKIPYFDGVNGEN